MAVRPLFIFTPVLLVSLVLSTQFLIANQHSALLAQYSEQLPWIISGASLLCMLFSAWLTQVVQRQLSSQSLNIGELENPTLLQTMDGELIYTNSAMETLTSNEDPSLAHNPLQRLFSDQERQLIQKSLKQLTIVGQQTQLIVNEHLNEEQVTSLVQCQLLKHNQQLVVRIEVLPIESIHNELIAEEKALQALLHEKTAALEHHQHLLKTVINSANFSIIITDSKGVVTTYNPAAEQMLGYPLESVLGHQPTDFIISSEVTSFRETLNSALLFSSKKSNPLPSKEWHLLHQQGHEVPALLSLCSVLNESDSLESLVIIALDLTDQKRYEEALLEAKEDAEVSNDEKNLFLASLGHEIRTPMNSILGLSELLQRTTLDDQQQQLNKQVISSANNLLLMLRDISDLSSIEAGKIELQFAPFNPDELLQEVASMVIVQTEETNIELLFNIDPNIPHQLIGDALRIKQVLLNLLNNALRYTPNGEIILNLAVIDQTDTTCTIAGSVCDTGEGIPKEQQTKIFNSFQQGNNQDPNSIGGYGLGLAICQQLLTKMGGHISLSSEEGKGSEFFFSMVFETSESDVSSIQLPPLNVLIVDDYPTARQLTQNMCDGLGWKTTSTDSARQALQYISEQSFDAALIDYSMPEMNGLALCKLLKQSSQKKLKTILLTSSHYPQLAKEIKEQGGQQTMDGFLTKPITPMQLIHALADDFTTSPPTVTETTKSALSGVTVLLVEDNLTNQAVATELLKEEGATIHLAENGLEALDYLRTREKPDVVLMDLQMPVLDGYSATERIRLELGFTDLPIIAMTANALPQDRQACLNIGMNDHIGKPFEINHLVKTISRFIPSNTPRPTNTVKSADTIKPTVQQEDESKTSIPPDALILARKNIIEIEPALMRLGGNVEVFQNVMRTFTTDSHAQLETLKTSLQEDDHETAGRALHTVKGMAATIGMTKLAELAKQYESHFRKEGTVSITDSEQQKLEELIFLYEAVILDILSLWAGDQSNAVSHRSKVDLAIELQCLQPLITSNIDKAKTVYQELEQDLRQHFPSESESLSLALTHQDVTKAVDICKALVEEARR